MSESLLFPYDVALFRDVYWHSCQPVDSAALAAQVPNVITSQNPRFENGVDYEEAIRVFRVPGLSRRGLRQRR